MRESTILRKAVAIAVIASFLSVTTACFGSFAVTRNVYHFNSGIKGSGGVSEKWMKEIVFFGMIIIPVYMFSALLDAFIFNAIQFWTGDNPVKVTHGPDGHIQAVELRDQTITVSWSDDHRSAVVIYQQQERIIKTALIIEEGNGYMLVDTGGQSVYLTEVAADGGLNIVDSDCRLVDHISFKHLQRASNELARASS